jgi:hypothetical protein
MAEMNYLDLSLATLFTLLTFLSELQKSIACTVSLRLLTLALRYR